MGNMGNLRFAGAGTAAGTAGVFEAFRSVRGVSKVRLVYIPRRC